MNVFENKFSAIISQTQTISDCNSPTLVASQLQQPFESLYCFVQGALRRVKGKALSGADSGLRSSHPPLFPLNEAYKKLIINLVGFFYVQKDAPKMH